MHSPSLGAACTQISSSLFFLLLDSLNGLRPVHCRGSAITLTRHSVRLLWTRDQPVAAENCTWQHTTFARDRHPRPDGIRTRNPSKRGASDTRLRPHGHWDRLQFCTGNNKCVDLTTSTCTVGGVISHFATHRFPMVSLEFFTDIIRTPTL